MPTTTAKKTPNPCWACLPGWGFHSAIWETILPTAPAVTKIFLDLPTPTTEFPGASLDKIITDLHAKIPPQATLLAWSLGGLLALQLCKLYPQRYQRLILVGCSPKFIAGPNWPGIAEDMAWNFSQAAEKNLAELMQKFVSYVQYPNQDKSTRILLKKYAFPVDQYQEHLKFYLELLMQTNLRSAYAALDMPLLHIFSEEDAIVPIQTAQHCARLNPHAVIKIIPGAGHAAFITHKNLLMNPLCQT